MRRVTVTFKSIIIAVLVAGLSGCGGDDGGSSPPPPAPPPGSGQAQLTLSVAAAPTNLPNPSQHLPQVKLDDQVISFKDWGGSAPAVSIDINAAHTIIAQDIKFQDASNTYNCSAPPISIPINTLKEQSQVAEKVTYTCKSIPLHAGSINEWVIAVESIKKGESASTSTQASSVAGDAVTPTLNILDANGKQVGSPQTLYINAPVNLSLNTDYTLQPQPYTYQATGPAAATISCKPETNSYPVTANTRDTPLVITYACTSTPQTDNKGFIQVTLTEYPGSSSGVKQPLTLYLQQTSGAQQYATAPIKVSVSSWGIQNQNIKVSNMVPGASYTLQVAQLKLKDTGESYSFTVSQSSITAPLTPTTPIPLITISQSKKFPSLSRVVMYDLCVTADAITTGNCTLKRTKAGKTDPIPNMYQNPVLLLSQAALDASGKLSTGGASSSLSLRTATNQAVQQAADSSDTDDVIRIFLTIDMHGAWKSSFFNSGDAMSAAVKNIQSEVDHPQIMQISGHNTLDGINLILPDKFDSSGVVTSAQFQKFLDQLQTAFSTEQERVVQIAVSMPEVKTQPAAAAFFQDTAKDLYPAIDYLLLPEQDISWQTSKTDPTQATQATQANSALAAYSSWLSQFSDKPVNRLIMGVRLDRGPNPLFDSNNFDSSKIDDSGFDSVDMYWISGVHQLINGVLQSKIPGVKDFAGVYMHSLPCSSDGEQPCETGNVSMIETIAYELWANLGSSGVSAQSSAESTADDLSKQLQVQVINNTKDKVMFSMSSGKQTPASITVDAKTLGANKLSWNYMQGSGASRQISLWGGDGSSEATPDTLKASINVGDNVVSGGGCNSDNILQKISALVATPYLMYGEYISVNDPSYPPIVNITVDSSDDGASKCSFSVGRVSGPVLSIVNVGSSGDIESANKYFVCTPTKSSKNLFAALDINGNASETLGTFFEQAPDSWSSFSGDVTCSYGEYTTEPTQRGDKPTCFSRPIILRGITVEGDKTGIISIEVPFKFGSAQPKEVGQQCSDYILDYIFNYAAVGFIIKPNN